MTTPDCTSAPTIPAESRPPPPVVVSSVVVPSGDVPAVESAPPDSVRTSPVHPRATSIDAAAA